MNREVFKALHNFTRERLRDAARKFDIKRGRNKHDTIENIIMSNNFFVLVYLISSNDSKVIYKSYNDNVNKIR